MDFENVRDALEVLMGLTNPENKPERKTIDGKWRAMNAHELQKTVYEVGSNICDLLGMEDIYLEGKTLIKKKED